MAHLSTNEHDTWYYPPELANDLRNVDLPEQVKAEALACAWEYTRAVVPHWTNWDRYLALMHLIALGVVAEFKGELVDIMASDDICGYSILSGLLATLFQGMPIRGEMERELHYDAVAFHKHRSEGEVCSIFAYMPEDLRIKTFRRSREVLWALDTAWAHQPKLLGAVNFIRLFGGAIHMLMRRYRFVDDKLTIGVPETEEIISLARANFKLWYRIEANQMQDVSLESVQRYKDVLTRREELLYPGLAKILETCGDGHCDKCLYPVSYGAAAMHCFGGVQLCDDCKAGWRDYLESFPDRAAAAFPELLEVYCKGIKSTGTVG
ncbi:hypothetical protein DFH06DRAFT_1317175 [Mycena polygramma]|nr:hypothetical protein DFH06DRAFT_1317175 [Mycena polygramma]